jgi:hypothetical protein
VAEIGLSTDLFLAHAADLFDRHPIARVILLDRHPIPRTGGSDDLFAVISGERPEYPHNWPPQLFPDVPEESWRAFPSLGRAMRALSDAAVAYGRKAAGLPPLESVKGVDTR